MPTNLIIKIVAVALIAATACQAETADEAVTNYADNFEIHVPHELLGSWVGNLFTAAPEEKLMPDMDTAPEEGFHSHMWQKPDGVVIWVNTPLDPSGAYVSLEDAPTTDVFVNRIIDFYCLGPGEGVRLGNYPGSAQHGCALFKRHNTTHLTTTFGFPADTRSEMLCPTSWNASLTDPTVQGRNELVAVSETVSPDEYSCK